MVLPFELGMQDPVSSVLHLGGGLFFLGRALPLLRLARDDRPGTIALASFVLAVLFQLWISGVYHLLHPGAARAVAQRLDHAGIFLLIAGTFTPCHVMLFRGFMRWGVLGLVWLFAIVGLVVKVAFFDDVPEAVGLGMYLGLGWVGVVSGTVAFRQYGARLVAPCLYGGLAYTFGSVLEILRWPNLDGVVTAHDVFHVFVLVGIALHWSFVTGIARRALRSAPVALS
jgi:channel protein (hemolysin III family)